MCLIYLMLLTVLSCCLFRNVSSTLVVVLWCAWNHEEFHIQGAADYKSPNICLKTCHFLRQNVTSTRLEDI